MLQHAVLPTVSKVDVCKAPLGFKSLTHLCAEKSKRRQFFLSVTKEGSCIM
jgi:hypothetical protein